MKAFLDPTAFASVAYADITKTGILETKLVRKWFLQVYYACKRYFDDPFYNLAKKYPHIFAGGHILDIGAHIGYTACVFADVLQDKYQVYAFEPESDNVSLLLESLAERGLEREIIPVAAACGRRDGTLDLLVDKRQQGSHRVLTDKCRQQLTVDASSQRVNVVSVDSFLSGRVPSQPVSFIKIDVQGYELEVCEGMRGTLARNERVCVAFEYAPDKLAALGFSPRKLLEYFLDRGFELYLLDRSAELVRLSEESLLKRLQARAYADLLACRWDPRQPASYR